MSSTTSGNTGDSFDEFYTEVKEIEKRDSVLTPVKQIERLLRPGSTYFNLNPFEVLQVEPDATLDEIKKKYRRLSILVHPDKNVDNAEKAQQVFEIVNVAWKTLENDETRKKCLDIYEEAKERTDHMIEQKRKKLKKENRLEEGIPEDDPVKYKHAIYVMTMKSHSDEARLLFNDTITKGMDCVNQRISEINEQIRGLSNTATEAIAFSNKALEDMRKCTAENAGNFISTGTCLGRVAVQTEMKAIVFASQSALTIGRISLSMATLPAALEVCAGSLLVDVGITTSKIVMEIGSCSASSVFTTFIGGTSGNSFVTAEVNPPVEIKIW